MDIIFALIFLSAVVILIVSLIAVIFSKEKRKWLKRTGYSVFAAVVSLAVVGVFAPETGGDFSSNETQNRNASTPLIDGIENTDITLDENNQALVKNDTDTQVKEHQNLANEEATTSSEVVVYMERLERELSSDLENIVTEVEPDRGLIMINLAVFGVLADLYYDGNNLNLSEAQELRRAEFKQRVMKSQENAFPILRDSMGPAMRKVIREMGVENFSVRTIGSGFTTIEFMSPVFILDEMRSEIYSSFSETYDLLRFNTVRFRWGAGEGEYTDVVLNTPEDRELIDIID